MVEVGRWWRYVALGLVVLLGLVGVVLLVWRVPPALYRYVPDPKDRAAAEASTRTGLIAGLAGLVALGGLFFTNRTYRLTQQGQLTDRYTKAIEQLGSAKLDVRLGGIYALERIAVDSERDHPTVVEVLSAFVREHSDPAHTDSEPTVAEVLSSFLRGDDESADKPQRSGSADKTPKPATDVRAAVTVLGRLPKRFGVSRGDLTGARLTGAQLDWADLSGARLIGVDLSGAQLHGANLQAANLQAANLSRAQFGGTAFYRAQLHGANLSGAQLDGADLSEAWLGGAEQLGRLIGANLSQAQLDEADLSEAWLIGAELLDATLYNANLSGADLSEAALSGAVLEGANLSGAWLGGAFLADARLNGANLHQALGLTQKQLDTALGNTKTRLPDGLQPPEGWGSDQNSDPSPMTG